jgi:carnitine O-acetyltransferase
MALSLDNYTLPSLPTDDPLRLSSIDAHVRNCASGINGGSNRWFDKALSVMVESSGRAGMMGEHSPVDALIPSIIVDYVLGAPVDEAQFSGMQGRESATGQGEGWQRLDWVVDEMVVKEIEECKQRNMAIIEDSDASQLWWAEYGADWIKKVGM